MEFIRNIDATFVFCFPAISLRCSIPSCTFFLRPVCIKSFGLYIFFETPVWSCVILVICFRQAPSRITLPLPLSHDYHLQWSAFKRKRAALAAKQSGQQPKKYGGERQSFWQKKKEKKTKRL